MGCNFRQRNENKGPAVHLRVRQNQPPGGTAATAWAPDDHAGVENIQIERPWPPMTPQAPACLPLQAFQQPQHC